MPEQFPQQTNIPKAEQEKLEREFFGERPTYLANGLDAWFDVCDMQANEGIRKLKANGERFEIFEQGMARYYHQEPKDIAAVEFQLGEIGKLPQGERLSVKRNFEEKTGNSVLPAFEALFSPNVQDEDLKKAGTSFYMGDALNQNLRKIANLDSSYSDTLLAWRKKDYEVHRRELTPEEFRSLCEALSARKKLSDFYKNVRKDYGFNILPESVKNKKNELGKLADFAGEKWWAEFRSAIKLQEAKK